MAYKVGTLIKELENHPDTMQVYMQKKEFFGNIGYVYNVKETIHPVFGNTCILLHDGDDEMVRPYGCISEDESHVTVRTLIKALKRYDADLEVMTKPKNGCKNFDDIRETEISTYGFFGTSISCILLCG